MTAPKRIQRRRTRGWTTPVDEQGRKPVYVGRGSKWGNPYPISGPEGLACVPGAVTGQPWEYEDRISAAGMRHDFFHPGGNVTACTIRNLTRAESVQLYRETLLGEPVHLRDPRWARIGPRDAPVTPDMVRAELAGRDLMCWCPLDAECHADVLLELANGGGGRG